MATPDICETIARNMRELRKRRKWTQQILADHAELTREHINKIESGEVEPGIRAMERISSALEVSLCDLLTPVEELPAGSYPPASSR